jgi:hypothetical protein
VATSPYTKKTDANLHVTGDIAVDGTAPWIPSTQKGAASGVATLDGSGLVPSSQIPPLAISQPYAVASQAAMLALAAQRGDVAIRTDISETFILSTDNPGTLADWLEVLSPTGGVSSFNTRTGAVTPASGDYAVADVTGAAPLASPAFTGTPTAPTAAPGTNTTQLATTAFVVANAGVGSISRQSVSFTTASIANLATATGTASVATTGILLGASTGTNGSCRVRLYSTAAARTADAARAVGTDPTPESGCLADLVLADANSHALTLLPFCFANADGTPSSTLYYSVTSYQAVATTFAVTLTYLALEA